MWEASLLLLIESISNKIMTNFYVVDFSDSGYHDLVTILNIVNFTLE